MTSARRIVVGDVHGQYDALMRLLEAIAPTEDDTLCLVGDLIDRGPKSAQVVDFVRNSPYECLMGNHEKMLLDICSSPEAQQAMLQGWLFSGGQMTLVSYQEYYGEPGVPQDHLDWMRDRPLYLDWGDYWIVHAGVDPTLPLEQQSDREFCWIRDPFHREPRPYFPDKTIVTGHTITFTFAGAEPGQLVRGCGWIDIDTGAYHPKSGWLSAIDLTNQRVYQANAYRHEIRTLPLDEIAFRVEPGQVVRRH